MTTDLITFQRILERMLAKGLDFMSTHPYHLKRTLPVVHAEIKGNVFCWASVWCGSDRDVRRLEFDEVDVDTEDPETCRGFILRLEMKDVGFGGLIDEETLSDELRADLRKEKERPRILPFAKEVMAGWRL